MKKKIFSDVTLNIFATLIPMFVLQFLLLPLVASDLDSNEYGQLLAIVAFLYLSAGTIGNILNNVRLINYKNYKDLNIQGDYSILVVISIIVNIIFMMVGLWYYGEALSVLSIVILILTSIFILLKNYMIVEFRIKLNFKNILYDSLLLLLGYIVGFTLFVVSGYWQFIYLCGFATSFVFVFKRTDILKEPLAKTPIFKKTTHQTITLLVSGILLALGTYIDKLLLYPLLDGEAVSIYYTATIIGKTISLVIQPITGVLLSYFAQLNKFETKYFHLLFVLSTLVGAVGYCLTILISKPLLSIVYPQFVEEALKYIHITTIGIIIIIITNILNVVILKFCDMRWQLIINLSYMVVYVVMSLILLYLYGLMGFCLGILIASIVKLIVMFVAYYINNSKAKLINKEINYG
jgi:O-antigen/teichoic acid export membrane protein